MDSKDEVDVEEKLSDLEITEKPEIKRVPIRSICSVDPGEVGLTFCFITFNIPEKPGDPMQFLMTDMYSVPQPKGQKGSILVSRIKNNIGAFHECTAAFLKNFKVERPQKIDLIVEQQFSSAVNETCATSILSAGLVMGCSIMSKSSEKRYRWITKHFGVDYTKKTYKWRKVAKKAIKKVKKVKK